MGSPGQLTWVFLLVALTSALCRGSSAAAVCNVVDKQALLTFKSQLIDNGKFLDPWKATTNCCTWPGVTCNSAGRVTTLSLLDTFAFPNAPADAQLKVKPGLKGAGSSLGALKALKRLEFRNVVFSFAYPIPRELGSLPALTDLVLIGTQCIGPIPAELGKLKSLSTLLLDGNRFPDGIPDALGDLASLTSLQVANNQMKKIGSERITLLKNLQAFDVSTNLLSGPIPKWLGKLTLSDYIQLGQNQFSGPIPGELCNIRGLKRIIIFETKVTAIPPQIGNCAALEELVLFDNKIAGKLPLELAKLKKLQRISVSRNQMSGPLPPALGDLPLLREFDIGQNKFSGPIPANYGPFDEDELSTNFSGNQLSGPIPKPLSNLRVAVFRPGNPGLCGAPLPKCK
ncbi:hypothetical protein M758_5G097600 [Ceratodon purpureus]|uniref:Leucine-rich repeat-containing N-terminal plant-type domain-containing protein n=1 Tax=Ceratodon purpureus TaxID=3225 RepID=A0A8T0I122_CERPU|nr:hypothetical protein KC19_5G134400 [Ceratodon purpureus]KAG0616192.1 hypothetical protein M758_5G097600 [Ceratodon purpureus]